MATKTQDIIINNADSFASDLASVIYGTELKALTNTLNKFRIEERRYSILKVRDESVCLLYREGKWSVFTSERGLETDLIMYDEIVDACQRVLYDMAESKEEYNMMVSYYNKEREALSVNKLSSKAVYDVIRKGLSKIAASVAM